MPGSSSWAFVDRGLLVIDTGRCREASSSGVKETWKSKLKSLPKEDAQGKCQPIRALYRPRSWPKGARETQVERHVVMVEMGERAVRCRRRRRSSHGSPPPNPART